MTTGTELASIVIPNFRTEELARLCLRAIRRLTDQPYEVIVVDNHSQDESLEYLRRIRWIRLIERGPEADVRAPQAHADAMDLGMAAAHGTWLVSMHTDTIVRCQGWLQSLIARLEANPRAAALGSDKIDYDSALYRSMKRMWDTHRMKSFLRRATGRPPDPRFAPVAWYPRSFCSIYRLEVVRRLGLSWQLGTHRAAGEGLYRGLVKAGYEGIKLAPNEMREYVEHVSHATALIGRGGLGHWHGNRKVSRTLDRIMGSDLARELLKDDSLDQ
jgi:glycosyltransferase involved in cell wall biosynthesis